MIRAPLVSVILPVYNTPKPLLDRVFSSVINQSFRDFEFLIVNDASPNPDVSVQLRELASHTDGISTKIIELKENLGISGARNAGLDAARGKYVCLVDHDDYWDNDYLETYVGAAKMHGADVVIGGFAVIDDKGEKQREFCVSRVFGDDYISLYSNLMPWSHIYRKSLLDEHGIRFPLGRLHEDAAFLCFVNSVSERPFSIDYNGYNYYLGEQSTCNADSFYRMNESQFPISYLKDVSDYAFSMGLGGPRAELLTYHIAELYMLFCCLYTKKSPRGTSGRVASAGADIIRQSPFFKKKYSLTSLFRISKNLNKRNSVRLSAVAYYAAARLHLERPFAAAICAINNILVR